MNTETNPTAASASTLDADAIRVIRRALLIGLTCYGEIEECSNAQGIYEMGGKKLPDGVKVLHPTGTCDVPSTFADALTFLMLLEPCE